MTQMIEMQKKIEECLHMVKKLEESLKKNNEENIFCSFCGKHRNFVSKLITNSYGLHICDECVKICVKLIEDSEKESE